MKLLPFGDDASQIMLEVSGDYQRMTEAIEAAIDDGSQRIIIDLPEAELLFESDIACLMAAKEQIEEADATFQISTFRAHESVVTSLQNNRQLRGCLDL